MHLVYPQNFAWALFIHQNFWFKFSATSNSKWKNIFKKFPKKRTTTWYPKVFKNLIPKLFFSFHFVPIIDRTFD